MASTQPLQMIRHGISLGLSVLLFACGSTNQAPVSEQGERQVVRAPIIVDSATSDASFNAPNASPTIVSSSGSSRVSTSRAASPVVRSAAISSSNTSSGQSTQPLPASHRVRPGDTLYSIAFEYDLDSRGLAIANGLRPPYTIFIDQELNLDLSRASNSASTLNSNVGTPVSNNSVARAQGTSNGSGAVTRQPISRVPVQAPEWQWPHTGRVRSAFGTGSNRGLDIAGQVGDPVWAASDGEVVYSGNGIKGSGNLIIIRHGESYLSAYAHNSAMLVSEGSQVRAGDKIAEVGQTDTGESMLHFEIRVDGSTVDPIRFLPQR